MLVSNLLTFNLLSWRHVPIWIHLRISHAQHICSSQDIPRFKCMYRNMKNISIIYFTLRNRQEHMTLHYIRALHHIILYIYILSITLHYATLHCIATEYLPTLYGDAYWTSTCTHTWKILKTHFHVCIPASSDPSRWIHLFTFSHRRVVYTVAKPTHTDTHTKRENKGMK